MVDQKYEFWKYVAAGHRSEIGTFRSAAVSRKIEKQTLVYCALMTAMGRVRTLRIQRAAEALRLAVAGQEWPLWSSEFSRLNGFVYT